MFRVKFDLEVVCPDKIEKAERALRRLGFTFSEYEDLSLKTKEWVLEDLDCSFGVEIKKPCKVCRTRLAKSPRRICNWCHGEEDVPEIPRKTYMPE
jgi:hypothetical protein